MADTCRTPDGDDVWTFSLTPNNVIIVVSILGFLPLATIMLGPKLVFYVGGTLGYYLRKKTAGRKAHILELVATEEKEYAAEGENRRDSDDWENVDAYATGTAKNGEKADREWDGIVGFFHPFWCVFASAKIIEKVIDFM
jgi:alpha-1,2-mannosyltransferase